MGGTTNLIDGCVNIINRSMDPVLTNKRIINKKGSFNLAVLAAGSPVLIRDELIDRGG